MGWFVLGLLVVLAVLFAIGMKWSHYRTPSSADMAAKSAELAASFQSLGKALGLRWGGSGFIGRRDGFRVRLHRHTRKERSEYERVHGKRKVIEHKELHVRVHLREPLGIPSAGLDPRSLLDQGSQTTEPWSGALDDSDVVAALNVIRQSGWVLVVGDTVLAAKLGFVRNAPPEEVERVLGAIVVIATEAPRARQRDGPSSHDREVTPALEQLVRGLGFQVVPAPASIRMDMDGRTIRGWISGRRARFTMTLKTKRDSWVALARTSLGGDLPDIEGAIHVASPSLLERELRLRVWREEDVSEIDAPQLREMLGQMPSTIRAAVIDGDHVEVAVYPLPVSPEEVQSACETLARLAQAVDAARGLKPYR